VPGDQLGRTDIAEFLDCFYAAKVKNGGMNPVSKQLKRRIHAKSNECGKGCELGGTINSEVNSIAETNPYQKLSAIRVSDRSAY
jgi:hypothetical protein